MSWRHPVPPVLPMGPVLLLLLAVVVLTGLLCYLLFR
ncbi:hypothetical protein Rmar_2281 [Rhodothermus marinus DSM 4252]|uniref:Uncharacterized protein n=1 Tax=Rhodothermus marinus (strain ATCC 43812 / DSM 4252 / R-10) TaxID=518766 RepID=D0MED2_RHOM4|nr:hypothetical protein Rmar_2281 [Rhodothermus marinus DSM 4252]